MYINETTQKHSKYKHIYNQNKHTLKNPHIRTPTHKKPNHTHTHTFQNPHILVHTHITKQVKTSTAQDTHQKKVAIH